MVVRYYFICGTCNSRLITRIGIGAEPRQEHVFACPNCSQDLFVALDLSKPPNVRIAELRDITQAKSEEEGEGEATIVNLHPEFIIPDADKHRDQVFPWLEQGHALIKKRVEEAIQRNLDPDEIFGIRDEDEPTVHETWKIVGRAWSLHLAGRPDLSQEILNQYPEYGGTKTLDAVIFHYLQFAFGPKLGQVFEPASSAITAAVDRNPAETERLRDYYRQSQSEIASRDVFGVLDDFFRSYADFRQGLVYAKFGIPLPDDAAATSENFRVTSMYYGNAFEALANRFVLPACLNNIVSGRRYDEFSKMNLTRYLQIDKAGKAKSFEMHNELKLLATDFDNQLRNASHHRRIRIDRKTGKIEYQTRQMAKPLKLSYAEYLVRCCSITINLAVTHMLELSILT